MAKKSSVFLAGVVFGDFRPIFGGCPDKLREGLSENPDKFRESGGLCPDKSVQPLDRPQIDRHDPGSCSGSSFI